MALCPGKPVPEESFTHPPSWSSSNLYQLLPSITIHSILPVQIACLAIFLHNLFPCPLWSTSWSGALHLIFHTFLHPNSVFFSQHMPIPTQPVMLLYQDHMVTGQLADTPTRGLPTRGLDISQTGQLADWTSRGLDYLRLPPTGVFVVLIAWLGYVDIIQLTE